jgi:hypothetical protein
MPQVLVTLDDREMAVLREMAEKKDLSHDSIMRQAFRTYQLVEIRFGEGRDLSELFPDSGSKMAPYSD